MRVIRATDADNPWRLVLGFARVSAMTRCYAAGTGRGGEEKTEENWS